MRRAGLAITAALIAACGSDAPDAAPQAAAVDSTPAAAPAATATPAPEPTVACEDEVDVVLREEALPVGAELARIESELRAQLPQLFGAVIGRVRLDAAEIAPATRSVRVAIRDPAAVGPVLFALRARPEVQSVQLDNCAMRANGP